jgi:predicted phosphodiesterase
MLNFLLFVLGLFFLWFLISYLRERKYRHQPYYRKLVRNWQEKVPPAQKPLFSVALIGDTGNVATDGSDPVLKLLQNWVQQAGKKSWTVFLGDNIYPKGIPPVQDRKRQSAEEKLQAQLRIFDNYEGKVTFIGGNHDWNKGRSDGYTYILRQEQYILSWFNYPEAFLPQNSCLGPCVVDLAPGLMMIVLNTQWWVQSGKKPIGKTGGCHQEKPTDFFTELAALLKQNQDKRIIIAAHHPLYSNALHGGKFTVKQHLFPLTAAHKKMYIPFPVVGSLYPLYRKYFGANEDMSHPRYRKMRKKLLNILQVHENVIYAAGHDHNLQYFHIRNNHFIISGSGSKTTFVKKGRKATFTHEHKGFFVIDFFEDQTWLRVLEPDSHAETTEAFRWKIWDAKEISDEKLSQESESR